MVTKKTPSTKEKASETKITKLKAVDETPIASTAKSTKSKKIAKKSNDSIKSKKTAKKRRRNPFGPIVGYFKGAWHELKLVHWPTRGATWGLTVAVLAFSAFFVVLILLLDALFNYLLRLIIG